MTYEFTKTLDPERPIHLAGIAGSAMNGLAAILKELGLKVVGTDPNGASVRKKLAGIGIPVYPEQDGSRIPEDAALVVASAALAESHPELKAARARNIPVLTYAECIGRLMSERRGVAVAGTHGKTTVTAMIVSILKHAGIHPGFVVGGHVPALGSGAAAGDADIFVAEACEYNRSFLNFFPEVGVITNIEADHLDVYGTFDRILEAFRGFIRNLETKAGRLVYSADCPHARALASEWGGASLSYGLEQTANLCALNCRPSAEGTVFDLSAFGESAGSVTLSVPGRHNVANALAAIGVCCRLDVPSDISAAALSRFTGASRRFELKGDVAGIAVVDDYAHHPTELRVLLESARQRFPDRHIILAFQPHQYSRTNALLSDFSMALKGADRVFVPNIFFARDSDADVDTFDPSRFETEMRRSGAVVTYLGSLSRLRDQLIQTVNPGDVVITAGAGDIDTIIPGLLDGLRQRFAV